MTCYELEGFPGACLVFFYFQHGCSRTFVNRVCLSFKMTEFSHSHVAQENDRACANSNDDWLRE